MDLGFIKAGFTIVWANDFSKEAVQTYKNNIGEHIVHGDIREISIADIPEADIVIGGFPCQGFSVANSKRSTSDERNFLYKEMLRVIKDKNPKMFVAENVKGLLSLEGGKVFEMIKSDFQSLGYHVEAKLLNAAEYGVPQARERLFIIGSRLSDTSNTIDFPEKCNSIDEAITTEQAIGWLADIRCQDEPIILENKTVYQHIAYTNVADKFWGRKFKVNQAEICDYLREWRDKARLTTKQIDKHFGYKSTAGHWFRKDRYGSIPKPSDWWILKDLLKFDDKFDEAVTTLEEKEIKFEQSLRITNWDRPSDTITATSPEIHINRMRRLSVRECAILQTFPEDFIFSGNSLGVLYRRIGNAVPVLLAQKIAEKVKEHLMRFDC